jgi:hypothetical protein
MVEVAQRLMRYSRFATPAAVKMLSDEPMLLDSLERSLEKGEDVPLFIQTEDLKKIIRQPIKDEKETGPTNIEKQVVDTKVSPETLPKILKLEISESLRSRR